MPRSDELVRQGWHFWSQRTRTGCERAIECFKRAIGESPSDFRAFEGLSASYLTLAIFGIRPPLEVYPRFLEAHEQAAILSGLRPELRCNRAFGLCVFERRYAESEAEFLRALEEKPALGSTYVRLGMLYGARGRFDEALDILGRGRQADPLLPTLAAAEVLVRCWKRDFQAAVSVGIKSVELHPYLHVVRVDYAQALEYAGRLEVALAQYQVASILSLGLPWLRALEGACRARLGRHGDARDFGRSGGPAPVRVRGRVPHGSVSPGARRARSSARRARACVGRELGVVVRDGRRSEVGSAARRRAVSPPPETRS